MAMQRGDLLGARDIAERARRAFPNDPALADAAGDLALKAGDAMRAVEQFAAAVSHAPGMRDYAINHAIALQRLDRHREAIAALDPHAREGRSDARYASVRAMSHRALADPAAAAKWYDVALASEPARARAQHGRARVALERGEDDAVQRFDAALRANPGDADLWLGKAQALEVAGDVAGAKAIAEQLCEKAPGFVAALNFLSGLRLVAGESDFAAPFVVATKRAPRDPNIPAAHCKTLAGLDHFAEAARVAADARRRFPDEPHFAMLEAIHSGSAGEWDRAERIFAELPAGLPGRAVHEARHRIRARDTERAETLLGTALEQSPWDVTAWALRGISWRISDTPNAQERARWLQEQSGLTQLCELDARDGLLDDVTGELRALHEKSAMPLGQSLRGGTQTRAVLFDRTEPLLAELHEAIGSTLERYRDGLPKDDPSHPLLRHRNTPWRLAGSWSVRLQGKGDYHTAHIHPLGILSSALYLVVPPESEDAEERSGWLEIGRPPPDLMLDLPPLETIRPLRGHLALFPSTAYHGTTPFHSAERMTVAFDVVASESAGVST
ncbi:MAG: tetratricopeptide repeat protein [Erythrobacter sp.]